MLLPMFDSMDEWLTHLSMAATGDVIVDEQREYDVQRLLIPEVQVLPDHLLPVPVLLDAVLQGGDDKGRTPKVGLQQCSQFRDPWILDKYTA